MGQWASRAWLLAALQQRPEAETGSGAGVGRRLAGPFEGSEGPVGKDGRKGRVGLGSRLLGCQEEEAELGLRGEGKRGDRLGLGPCGW